MEAKPKSYPSDVSDEEWSFCVSYVTLMDEAAPQRVYPLREIFNALRCLVRTGGTWRMMPHDLPPWHLVYQQTQRWIKAGCFEAMAHDLRAVLRLALERKADPSAVILDSRTLQSTPESGGRAGFDGHKKRKGSKLHAAVDTLGPSAGGGRHARQRTGPGAGGTIGPSGAGSRGRTSPGGLRRSGLYRRRTGGSGGTGGH